MRVQVIPHPNADNTDMAADAGFESFCNDYGLRVVIRERDPKIVTRTVPRWYATAEPHIEIRHGNILATTFGNGETPDEALRNFARLLRGETLVIDGYRERRREFNAPASWV